MASTNNTTFGASIVPVESRNNTTTAPQIPTFNDSPSITPAASHEDLQSKPTQSHPYQPTRTSTTYHRQPSPLEPALAPKTSRRSITSTEKDIDLEAGPTAPLASHHDNTTNEENPFTSKISVDINKECTMWPSKQTLLDNRAAEKKRKRSDKLCGGCGVVKDSWGRLTQRQKLLAKILVAVVLVGAMVGIAVGVTLAVNGKVYVSEGSSEKIPEVR